MHTGAVVTGLIGTKLPKYSVFGRNFLMACLLLWIQKFEMKTVF